MQEKLSDHEVQLVELEYDNVNPREHPLVVDPQLPVEQVQVFGDFIPKILLV